MIPLPFPLKHYNDQGEAAWIMMLRYDCCDRNFDGIDLVA